MPARLLTGLLVLALATAGCSSGPGTPSPVDDTAGPGEATPSASATAAADRGPRPEIGECHALSWRQALAPEALVDPVRCSRPHTAQTYAVGRLDLEPGALVDSAQVQQRVQRTCTERLPRHLAAEPRDLRLSMAQAVWFTPGVEQVEAGANWFRCDVVVVAADRELLRLPVRTEGWGPAPAIAMCATAAPGTRAFARVTCGSTHSWVAVSTVDLPGTTLPRPPQVRARMDPACRDAARTRASDPLSFTWSQESPTREQWDVGQRYGICWAPDS